jgi:phage/conjugal plasmid C-4 type zinc finger TraR family protein
MSDLADAALEREEAELEELLRKQQRAAALEEKGNEICSDCGEPIPEERRRAMPSALRCIDCQAWTERVSKAREEQEKARGR